MSAEAVEVWGGTHSNVRRGDIGGVARAGPGGLVTSGREVRKGAAAVIWVSKHGVQVRRSQWWSQHSEGQAKRTW